jgi:hypothetical protein
MLAIEGRLSSLVLMRSIGMNLVSLECVSSDREGLDGIFEYCPNLRYLNIRFEGEMEDFAEVIKRGLPKLAILVIDGRKIRLGTEWEG